MDATSSSGATTTTTTGSQTISVCSALRRNAHLNPQGIATHDVPSQRVQTWAQVFDSVQKLAHVLTTKFSLNRGDRVAILAFNSDAYFELLYACAWAGLISVPLNFRLSTDELKYVLADAGAKVLCVDDGLAKSAWPALKPVVSPSLAVCLLGAGVLADAGLPAGSIALAQAIGATKDKAADAGACCDDIATLVYTGGTTGKAKGVMLTHCNLVFNALGTLGANRFNPKTRFLHVAPMFHLADMQVVFANTLGGGSHYFVPRFAPPDVMGIVQTHLINKFVLVPVMIQMVVNLPDIEERTKGLKTHEIEFMYGGSPMPPSVMARVSELLPKARLFQVSARRAIHRTHRFAGLWHD